MLRDYATEVREALAKGERGEASRLLDEAIALAEQKAIRVRVALDELWPDLEELGPRPVPS